MDDLSGIEDDDELAMEAFYFLGALLSVLGLDEAVHKALPPATRRKWLGIIFDTVKLTLEIPAEKLCQIKALVADWLEKDKATKRELQSIIGKLLYIAKCVKPARLFIGRMLATLRLAPERGSITLDKEFKMDIKWFSQFLPCYNGVSMMHQPRIQADKTVHLDSCLSGVGAICHKHYYHARFPSFIVEGNHHISQLELLNILVACKAFHTMWAHHTVEVHCDNEAAVSILNSGRCKDLFMLSCARQIWMYSATYEFTIVPIHESATNMTLPDALSRYHLHDKYVKECHSLQKDPDSIEVKISDDHFKFEFAV